MNQYERLIAGFKEKQPTGPWSVVALDDGMLIGGCIAVAFSQDFREWTSACLAAGLQVCLMSEVACPPAD